MHATVIKLHDWSVSTVEHILAAIVMLGIDNIVMEVEGGEIPIIDGSALSFVQGINSVGVIELDGRKRYMTPKNVLVFKDKGREIKISPAKKNNDNEYEYYLHVDYSIEFDNKLVGKERLNKKITKEFFVKEIAPARTFGFLDQMHVMRKYGLAKGASLGNTVVVRDEDFMNESRFSNEFVRHKVLDLIGDLSLLGRPLIGFVEAHRTGHSFNRLVIDHYINNPNLWVFV
jgi:UDP-3-O-[3-hydroxymyristoyl] N-acetylglucosamine deacetylase